MKVIYKGYRIKQEHNDLVVVYKKCTDTHDRYTRNAPQGNIVYHNAKSWVVYNFSSWCISRTPLQIIVYLYNAKFWLPFELVFLISNYCDSVYDMPSHTWLGNRKSIECILLSRKMHIISSAHFSLQGYYLWKNTVQIIQTPMMRIFLFNCLPNLQFRTA